MESQILQQILDELKELKANQSQTHARLEKIKTRQAEMSSRLDGIDSRLDEHFQLLRALEHASEVHKADMDNLTHQVARLSQEMNAGFKKLTEISKSLMEMYGEHEAEIRTIKRRF